MMPRGAEAGNPRRIQVPGVDFAIDPGLAHPPGDELGVLGAEIEDQNPIGMDGAGVEAHEVSRGTQISMR
jgi:hypothetical protein